ncbi:MAG: outer membrane beta-barrel protein [Bacteroides sp.]|nr:outer membrane beta-barrel protein [Bacteroides sp.]MCM1379143.1 outer membrane beta-barrel protein [Bacteroides sp.]MCM1445337.1 outer membrane beta-barrel protein [Prevotella sp.]
MKKRIVLFAVTLAVASVSVFGQPVAKKYKSSGFSKFSISYGLTMYHYDKTLKDYANFIGQDVSNPLNLVSIEYAVAWRLGYQSNWTLGFGFRAGMGFSSDKSTKKLSDSPYGQELNSQLSELRTLYNSYVQAGYHGTQLTTVKSQLDAANKLLNTTYTFSSKTQMITMTIPVNIGYQFCLNNNVGLTPYAGINLKINAYGRSKDEVTDKNGNVQKDLSDSDWVSIYDPGSPDIAIAQFGWQAGLGLSIKKFYIGAEFGTDFVPFRKIEISKQSTGKIYTQNLTISAGIYF